MGKWVQLNIDNTSERAYGITKKSSMSFTIAVPIVSEYAGEILSQKEIEICTAPDVNRFKVYLEKNV